MTNEQPISKERFIKRLSELCLKSALFGFPKDDLNQQILLKSAVLMMDASDSLTEKSINETLDRWVKEVSHIEGIDFVTVRRALIDAGYMVRTKDGSSYHIVLDPRPDLFNEKINELDIPEVIAAAREEIARRKQEYLDKAKPK
jgi:hypothetical protein